MPATGPWSVKGIDARARDAARSIARREGLTLGEYLNRLIPEPDDEAGGPANGSASDEDRPQGSGFYGKDGEPDTDRGRDYDLNALRGSSQGFFRGPAAPPPPYGSGFSAPYGSPFGGSHYPPSYGESIRRWSDGMGAEAGEFRQDEMARMARALERLSHRIESTEHRSSLAIGGIEQSVNSLLTRIEGGDRNAQREAQRMEETLRELHLAQQQIADKIRKVERDGNGDPAALRQLESSLARLTQHVESRDGRAKEDMAEVNRRIATFSNQLEESFAGAAESFQAALQNADRRAEAHQRQHAERLGAIETRMAGAVEGIEESVRRISDRLNRAEGATNQAIIALEKSFHHLDNRLSEAEKVGLTPELSAALSKRVDSLAGDLAKMIATTRDDLATELETAVRGLKSGKIEGAVDQIGDRLTELEQRQQAALGQLGAEIQGVTAAFEKRIALMEERQQNDPVWSEMQERLGALESRRPDAEMMGREIGQIADRLESRLAQAEQANADAIENIGKQVSNFADRLQTRQDASVLTLSQKIQESEERAGQKMASAFEAVTARIDGVEKKTEGAVNPVQRAVAALARRLESLEDFTRPPFAPGNPPIDIEAPDEPAPLGSNEMPPAMASMANDFDVKFSSGKTPVETVEIDAPGAALDDDLEFVDLEPKLSQLAQAFLSSRGDESSAQTTGSGPLSAQPVPMPGAGMDPLFASQLIGAGAEDRSPAAMRIAAFPDPMGDDDKPLDLAGIPDHDDLPDDVDPYAFMDRTPHGTQDLQDDFNQEPLRQALKVDLDDGTAAPEESALDSLFGKPLPSIPPKQEDFLAMARKAAQEQRNGAPAAYQAPAKDKTSGKNKASDKNAKPARSALTGGGARTLQLSAMALTIVALGGVGWQLLRGKQTIPARGEVSEAKKTTLPSHEINPGVPSEEDKAAAILAADPEATSAPDPTLHTPDGSASDGAHQASPAPATPGAHGADHEAVKPAEAVKAPNQAATTSPVAAKDLAKPAGKSAPAPAPATPPAPGKANSAKAATPVPAIAPPTIATSAPTPTPSKVAIAPPADPASTVAGKRPGTIEQAAAAGDPIAQYELALARLEKGDRLQGSGLLRRAADQGLPIAQYRLAKAYERGEGVKADLAEARRWTENAARGGNRKAMHDTAVYFAEGDAGPQDYGTAAQWFRRAAERGLPDSQYNLGVLFEQGLGVKADPVEAVFWFSLAARAGDKDASQKVANASSRLNAEQNAAIRERVNAYAPRPIDPSAQGEFGARSWQSPSN